MHDDRPWRSLPRITWTRDPCGIPMKLGDSIQTVLNAWMREARRLAEATTRRMKKRSSKHEDSNAGDRD